MRIPAAIQAHRGFGNDRVAYVSGQVTFGTHARVQRARAERERYRVWRRVRDALRLAISPRIPHARVRIHCGGVTVETTSDRYGNFATCLLLPSPDVSPAPWREYRVELVEPQGPQPVTARSEVLLATAAAEHVVVSDIDDTVIYTGVSNKLKMLWRLFARGVEGRVPFPGISALYRALFSGGSGDCRNPMIYVSRSPWAIYPTLEEFFQQHRIPTGPVLQLREWGISLTHPFPRRARNHKRRIIEQVMAVYADLPLVLIGDSGQHDPELYVGLAGERPERVAAIYIRDLGLSRRRSNELEAFRADMAQIGVPMVVAADTGQLASDAAARGWISAQELDGIHAQVRRDLG